MKNMVKEHNELRHLEELDHYETHIDRSESVEFRKLKEEFHNEDATCFISNGYCEGDIEIHHSTIEWSDSESVDWDKVKRVLGFDHTDVRENAMPLCTKHHRGRYTGIHNISYPKWILQKFYNTEALEDFEKQIKVLLDGGELVRDGEI
jgi:hypothetical protein